MGCFPLGRCISQTCISLTARSSSSSDTSSPRARLCRPSGWVRRLLSASEPIENVAGIAVQQYDVLEKLVDRSFHCLCPKSAPLAYVQCNIVSAVCDGSFVSPYCPCEGCTFFVNAPTLDMKGATIINPVLIARPDGTTLRNFASIDTLSVADGVSNAYIVGTDSSVVETVVVNKTRLLRLDSVFINTITLTHPTELVSNTVASIDVGDIEKLTNRPTTRRLWSGGRWRSARCSGHSPSLRAPSRS